MRTLAKVLPILLLMFCGYASLGHAAQPRPERPALPVAPESEDTLEAQLLGTWVLMEAKTPGKPSGIGLRRQTFTSSRWEIIQKDPETGKVIFHHGGTYHLDGDILEKTVEFAGTSTKSYKGRTHKFRIKIEKGTYTQIGIGNPFDEVWRRDGI
ncbi:MAG: hypothetical protein V4773_16320 [Verrucomicrobiota bacterium]